MGIRKKYISHILMVVLFVLVFFSPNIRIGIKISWFLALAGGMTLFDRKFMRTFAFNSRGNSNFWMLFIFACVYLALQPFIHFTGDISYIVMLIGTILTLLRCLLLVYALYKTKKEFLLDKYCEYFIEACCVYVAFTILFIIFPEFKSFWLNSVLDSYTEATYAAYQFRYSLDGFAAFSSSSLFSLAAIISGYLISNDKKASIAHILKFIVVAGGCFFYGRIAFVGIVLGALLMVLVKGNLMKTLKIMLVVGVIVGVLISLLNYLGTINESFVIWKNWAFAFVKQLFVEREITDYSFTHMFKDMYFLPDFTTFIAGDGRYTEVNGSYYMHTDVGYMRLMLYAGVIGVIITFIPVIYLLRKTMSYSPSKTVKYMVIAIFVVWLVLEAKGDAYHRILMTVYPMFLILLATKKQNVLAIGKN